MRDPHHFHFPWPEHPAVKMLHVFGFSRTENRLDCRERLLATIDGSNADSITSIAGGSRCTGPPGDVQLLSESHGSIVVGQLTSGVGVAGGEGNTVVDVEDTVGAAWRPDGSRGLDLVLLGVDLAVKESTAAGEGGSGGGRLRSILGEVVGCDERSGNAGVQACEAVVCCVNNSVLEASRVLQVQMKLAVLGMIRSLCSRANVGLELIEAVRDDSLVNRCRGRDGSLRTSITGVGAVNDGDQSRIRTGSITCNGVGGREKREEEGEFGVHIETV
jgi:hypothetical protein